MRRTGPLVLLALLLAAPAAAQGDLLDACGGMTIAYETAPGVPGVPPGGSERQQVEEQFRFLCGQVVTALTNVQPTLGIAFSGGAHTLGTATTIGRRLGIMPRISVTVRANAALAEVPGLLDDYEARLDPDGELPPMGTSSVPVGALQGDLVVGLFNGFSGGPALGGFGAVDLLGSLSYVPAIEESGLDDGILNWGAGARIGIIRQGLVMPGVSVSAMYRSMDRVSFGDIDAGDPAHFATDLSTVSFRGAISKGVLAFNLAAGVGYDIYSSDVQFDFELECDAPDPCPVPVTLRPQEESAAAGDYGIDGELSTAAWNVFGNVGLNLLLLNVVAEVGYQRATELVSIDDLRDAGLPDRAPTTDALDEGRFFGSLGIRLTL